MKAPLEILKKYWGYDAFRPLQEDIIASVLAGNDTLGLLPTGGGKSITFQVPGLVLGGLTLVITPLISLMKDQADHLIEKGIKAAAVYMGMTHQEVLETYEKVIREGYHFLYLSPERLHTQLFQAKLPYMNVRLLVVDEAHCISQWGYDFRPPYLRIAEIRTLIDELQPLAQRPAPGHHAIPCMALTATATPAVVADIQHKLHFNSSAKVFKATFERPNLTYSVLHAEDKLTPCLRLLDSLHDPETGHWLGSAIVYVRSRKKTAELSEALTREGLPATFYHAGLRASEKEERQNAWMSGEVPIVVATNAFGMGIDKPDVRIVIHIDLPTSPEEYFQEAGRAGRDQKPATAYLIACEADKSRLINNLNESFPERDFIRMVYARLGNFFQIAVGAGCNHLFEFDIYRFCSAYRLSMTPVYHALRLLAQAGYIVFDEDPESHSRLMFTCSREHLYHLEKFDPECQRIITALLRLYTGLFADYQRISEEALMRYTNLEREQLYQKLLLLSRFHVLHYIPARQMPAIIYLTNRLEDDEIRINHTIYEDRQLQQQQRIEGMTNYIDDSHTCRLVHLLNYFGEHLNHTCGKCDVCLLKTSGSQGNPIEEAAFLRQQILNLLKTEGQLTLQQILTALKQYPQQTVADLLRTLINNKEIVCTDYQFSLIG